METMTATASMRYPHQPANYDEVSMLFSDSLKDLKNLREQLYSAAEYFEVSCTNDKQKHILANALKDYAIKALVNTVDHLGSVTYKVNDLLHENINEASGTEFRVSCLEQRLRTCHDYINREGLSQQSLVIDTPNYHKRYILPVKETIYGSLQTNSKNQSCSLDNRDERHQFKNAVRGTIHEAPPSIVTTSCSKGRSPSPNPGLVQQQGNFAISKSMPNKDLERRTVSPHRFPLLQLGSLSSKPATPRSSRPTTPNPSLGRQSYITDPRKSASIRIRVEESPKQFEQIPSKSKRLLKALLTRRRTKKDDMLYRYLDEY